MDDTLAWLVAGAVLSLLYMGRQAWGWAAWLAPLALLRFVHEAPPAAGALWIALVLFAAGALAHRGILPLAAPAYLGANLYLGALGTLPYAADRWLAGGERSFAATLVFPAAWVATELLSARAGPGGTWGALAYTQHRNLPLLQTASVTGIAGVAFLMSWPAAVASWAWERGLSRPESAAGLLACAAALGAAHAAGALRLARARDEGAPVRAALLGFPQELLGRGDLIRFLRGLVPAESRAATRAALARVAARLGEQTRREARAGARLVAWPEAALLALKEDEPAQLEAACRLAREERIHLFLGMATVEPGAARPLENRALLVDPQGEVRFSYLKHSPVPGWEAAASRRGPARLPAADTALGRISAAVCFDLDFPHLVRQAGRAGASLLCAPANDWVAIQEVHLRMAAVRALENGLAIVRPASPGISAVIDRCGRLRARLEHRPPGGEVLRADVPPGRVPTLYVKIGDGFAWLCLAGVAAAAVWRIVAGPH